ncbi:MAG TPA: HAD hydrolase family protein [Candidatus Limnocylindrales bacterium]|nr:HAD hydrolase family protein [Candidatus Limnocylindrales bacterium]
MPPIDNIIVDKEVIEKSIARKILQICLDNNIYVEFYTLDDYFIHADRESDITKKHFLVLQREPKKLQDIVTESEKFEITKIMPIALNAEDKLHVAQILNPFKEKLSISWGAHPVILPLQIGIITAPESSKKEGSIAVAKSLSISFEDILGIGDSTSDWSFMELCGYAATLENGSRELKDLIKQKGENKYFIGKSVDENGILDILSHFKL